MEDRTVFVALLATFFAGILILILSTPLARAVGQDEAQTTPYSDPTVAEAAMPSRCSSMFQILDANRDGYINDQEAKKSAEATATWKNLDSNLDNRISFAEYCATRK